MSITLAVAVLAMSGTARAQLRQVLPHEDRGESRAATAWPGDAAPDRVAAPLILPAGYDYWTTLDGTYFHFGAFGAPPITAGFFCSGGSEWSGQVVLEGDSVNPEELGNTSTTSWRPVDVVLDPAVGPVTVTVEMVALSLVSTVPITVDCPPAPPEHPITYTREFDVLVSLDPNRTSGGTMKIGLDASGGGGIYSDVSIGLYVVFDFVAQDGGGGGGTVNYGDEFQKPLIMEAFGPYAWQTTPTNEPPFPGSGPNFYPLDPMEVLIWAWPPWIDPPGKHPVKAAQTVTGCCLPPGAPCICRDLSPKDCVAQGGNVQAKMCANKTRACCLGGNSWGDCLNVDPVCCDDCGGIGQAPGSRCAGNPPPTVKEACCLADDSCFMSDPICCDDLPFPPDSGQPAGAGTSCSDTPDPCVTGTATPCCLPDGQCVDTTRCLEQNGVPVVACLTDTDGDGWDEACAALWYWKDYNDADPNGYMPDYDQNKDFNNDGVADLYYCGPTAVANSIWWFDHKFPDREIVPAGVDKVGLTQDLAQRMGTNDPTASPNGHPGPYVGTYVDDMQSGIDDYLSTFGLKDLLYVHRVPQPDFGFIATEVQRSQDVVLLLGFWHIEAVELDPASGDVVSVTWVRRGGHYVTVAGVNKEGMQIAVSDPDADAAEAGAPGVVRGTHNHGATDFRDPNYNHYLHNDKGFASHDIYTAGPSLSPGGILTLIRRADPLIYGQELWSYHEGDAGGASDQVVIGYAPGEWEASGYPWPEYCQFYTEVEAAVVVSPWEGDCCDGIDNDVDGLTDCDDPECPHVANENNTAVDCADECDNDCDGCTDSADADCGGTETDCTDGVDDDCDGSVDCHDPDCATDPACVPEACCLWDGTCVHVARSVCCDMEGVPQAAGLTCADVVCPPPPPISAGINIDVHQDNPGEVANDFHIEGWIESEQPPTLEEHIDDLFPNFTYQIKEDPPGNGLWYWFEADWSGYDYQYCEVLHLGLRFKVWCHNVMIDLTGWWTKDGVRIGALGSGSTAGIGAQPGFWPVLGFDVEDNVRVQLQPEPPDPNGQHIRIQTGNNDGEWQPGEFYVEVVQMDLATLTEPFPLSELCWEKEDPVAGPVSCDQATLTWVPVLHEPGGPEISEDLPLALSPWAVDSFFDVFYEIPQPGHPTTPTPMAVQPGGYLLARQKVKFLSNATPPTTAAAYEYRWFWEIHEAHKLPEPQACCFDDGNCQHLTPSECVCNDGEPQGAGTTCADTVCLEAEADLGDAPDSSNSHGQTMWTYPANLQANFPSVFAAGSPPHGPIHWRPEAVAFLGRDVTFEDEADLLPDEDGVTNIDPLNNAADQDGADDGVNVPLVLPHCVPTTFDYEVTIVGPVATPLYVNAWFDWNRDADWDDSVLCPGAVAADEWAVQNQLISFAAAGTYTVTTPSFMPAHLLTSPSSAPPIWMRITLSEQPWDPAGPAEGYGGSGPPGGYDVGETEDYYFTPVVSPAQVKWSQPPVPAENVFYGWNEESRACERTAADDWLCQSEDAITGVRWWGSFKGWKSPTPPIDALDHFHMQIWSDVPAGADEEFSHPGVVIHEMLAGDFTWDFAGWDYDPRTGDYEAAFVFEYTFRESEYFHQKPDHVYWLSIGFCGDPTGPEWGWKTVLRDTASPAPDDAVVMPNPANICPFLGTTWGDMGGGFPIWWPTPNESWDLAFELIGRAAQSEIKWQQAPDTSLPGLHAHDSMDGTGSYETITLADQFECQGGLIHDLHWYGNYELDPDGGGVEVRGSGIRSFHLSLHDNIPGNPWCLPGPTIWSTDVPFEAVMEQDTGLTNSEGSRIYHYRYYLPIPIAQETGRTYWFDIAAISRDPSDPPLWRWQEAGRNTTPILCPAAYQIGPIAQPWQSIGWADGTYTDLAFDITSVIYGEATVKWSQPPQSWVPEDAFKGWDELSMYATFGGSQIVADDWFCDTNLPVTDVHWWGSHLGWDRRELPHRPRAFHIGIWTDQMCSEPGGAGNFSCPRTLIHEYECEDYRWRFVGWDVDPREPAPLEATFKYACDLPEASWFYQEPGPNIYWVSIAAVYDVMPSQYPWGWKVRPRDPTSLAPDDAVRIFDPTNPSLRVDPPIDQFGAGEPIYWPDVSDSWDMAFELTGRYPVPDPPDPDPIGIDKNRFVSFEPAPGPAGGKTGIRVRLTKMYDGTMCPPRLPPLTDLSVFEGEYRWVGPPEEHPDEAVPAMLNMIAAPLVCCPYFHDWTQAGLAAEFGGAAGIPGDPDTTAVHVYGAAVTPCSVYDLQTVDEMCEEPLYEECFSLPLTIGTAKWGDVWTVFYPSPGQPNFIDIDRIVQKFKGIPYVPGPPEDGAPPKARAMLRDNVPPCAEKINFIDIGSAVEAFKLLPYKQPGPSPCPPCP